MIDVEVRTKYLLHLSKSFENPSAVFQCPLMFTANSKIISKIHVQLKKKSKRNPKNYVVFFRLAQISIQVTKDDLDTFFGPHKEWCRCEAWSRAGHVKSNKAYVKLASKLAFRRTVFARGLSVN